MEQETKKLELSHRLFITLLVLILGLLGFFTAIAVFKFKSIDYPREITVSAEGKVFAKPDIAFIKLGVTTEGWVIKDVLKENTEKMNAVLKEVKNLGIDEKDIQTTRYNLTPRYEWTKEGQRIFRGYLLEQEVLIKIRNFEKIGEVMDRAAEKGANLIGDLSFSIDDPELIREKARTEAIKRAKAKAEKIAQQTGLRLKKLINVYEDYFYPVPRGETMKDYGGVGGGAITAAPVIQPGEQEVTVKINLVYRVK
ncbi:MAG: SIMPL domain-containing protein [Patescibacteria group bacterium]|nr:SIMPL domain-containing protein [Patescibacteria group bacterium]